MRLQEVEEYAEYLNFDLGANPQLQVETRLQLPAVLSHCRLLAARVLAQH